MIEKAWGEVKEIYNGPEGVFSETGDALVAIGALLSVHLFSRPALRRKLAKLYSIGKSIGLG